MPKDARMRSKNTVSRNPRNRPPAMLEAVKRIEGLFVGQLTEDELMLFEAAVKAGLACRSYEGGAGFMGLAKVRITPR